MKKENGGASRNENNSNMAAVKLRQNKP